MNNNYQLLIRKLDRFIRKYYFNKLIKGLLISVGLVVLAFILINVLEYFLWSSTTTRKVLFYGFIGLSGITALFGVIIPLLHIFKLGRVISHKQAAEIIGQHFKNVKDKLLNILQLKDQANRQEDTSLIEASIDQKANEIKLVPFRSAIDLSQNSSYLKYALIPLLFLGGILFLAPKMITESAERIINNDVIYEKEAPFSLSVKNTDKLEVIQFEDITVEAQVDEGSQFIPNDAYIHINGFPYKLNKKKNKASQFFYKFNKLQKDVEFFLEADGIRSKTHTIKVIPKPAMLSFDASLNFPPYIGRKKEVLRNSGDMVIPLGTKVTWGFEAQHTDTVRMKFGKKKLVDATRKSDTRFVHSKRFLENSDYMVFLSNERIKNADSVAYAITVIPDLFPTISAEERRDTVDNMVIYFVGDATDDYGIKEINFLYKIIPEDGLSPAEFQKLPMKVNASRKASSFTHTWDLLSLGLNSGDRLSYYFEVWDNDGVNGSKSAKSQMMSYQLPSIRDMEEEVMENNEELKEDVEDIIEDAQELREEVKEVKDKLIQKKNLDWEDREQIQSLIKQHQQMQSKIQNVKENYQENMEKQDEFKEMDKEVKEKHEKLQKMMDELMTDELRELMEKLQEMMEDMEKEDMMEELEDFEMTDEQLEQELDRMLELFKQLEFEQKLQETIDKLNELAEEQEKLSEETEKDQNGLQEEKKKQESLNKKFDDIKKDMEELSKMSEELGKKEDAQKETEEMSKEVDQKQDQSMQDMQQQQKQEAGKNQKKAAQKMQEMAQSLQMMQMMMQQDQQEMDMKAIRQLLENLLDLSMNQEDVMGDMSKVTINTPRYVDLVQQQHKLKDDAVLVKDSLVALSKRVFQLEAFITREIAEVNRNMEDALDKLEERKKDPAATNQQFIMTGINNLALMLNEVQQQMQQQMAQQMKGNQMCQNPGQKPGGVKGLKSMQQQLNDQIKMLQGKCQKPGGMMPGQYSKEAAQLAAKQAAIRQALEKINQDKNKDGKQSMGDLGEIIKDMEKTEEDLVNKRLTSEMLERQQMIMSRMLKAEDAEKERELDDKREAKTAKKPPVRVVPEIVEEYKKKQEAEIEMYKTVPPTMKPFYKELVDKYFKSIRF